MQILQKYTKHRFLEVDISEIVMLSDAIVLIDDSIEVMGHENLREGACDTPVRGSFRVEFPRGP